MSGKVVHFEIPFDDGDRARTFYREAFGWQVMAVPDMDYTMVMTGPSDPEKGPTEPGFRSQRPDDRPTSVPAGARSPPRRPSYMVSASAM